MEAVLEGAVAYYQQAILVSTNGKFYDNESYNSENSCLASVALYLQSKADSQAKAIEKEESEKSVI
ncbi:MAG TPA: hypothetical protein VJK54_07580 [Chthoniobacterales bacterium]|nr:hypothetical protein [Chthoniobacterales bacterium]